ncbi:MAG: CPBP family intramembrane metalloprotease [Bifidobacteriaceae bacterium]|jgi:membrane protease YdiL (CAAX protease family)|nr:CPBP family intramembrane metalloprotease [Bifidobacteriaceae bacterium]
MQTQPRHEREASGNSAVRLTSGARATGAVSGAEREYSPGKYFGLTFAISWSCYAVAAVRSHNVTGNLMEDPLISAGMILGLFGPLIAAAICMAGPANRSVRSDFKSKLLDTTRINKGFWPLAILGYPALIAVAVAASTPFGGSLDQLALSPEFSIVEGAVGLSWLIAFTAPALEELGWSGYGIDSLRGHSPLIRPVLLFGILWSAWHLPLFFVKGYYHANLLAESPIYALAFLVGVVPLTVITNWIYYRNGRSIVMAVVFHAVVNVSSEAFMVTNATKTILYGVLIAVAAVLVGCDRRFFLSSEAGRVPVSVQPGK